MSWFIAVVEGMLLVWAIAYLLDFFYRMITENDVEYSWKEKATCDIIGFLICLILFLGLKLGW